MSTRLIIKFESKPPHESQPWPVGVTNGVVTSGLGEDDGAHLIGFGPQHAYEVTVFAKDAIANPESVVGLVPTFGKGTMFSWDLRVAELTVTEIPDEAEPEQRGAYLRTDEEG